MCGPQQLWHLFIPAVVFIMLYSSERDCHSTGPHCAGCFKNPPLPARRTSVPQPPQQPQGSRGNYTYSYSSYTGIGGPSGNSFSRTVNERRGQGGVYERNEAVLDGYRGQDSLNQTRGLGDQVCNVACVGYVCRPLEVC